MDALKVKKHMERIMQDIKVPNTLFKNLCILTKDMDAERSDPVAAKATLLHIREFLNDSRIKDKNSGEQTYLRHVFNLGGDLEEAAEQHCVLAMYERAAKQLAKGNGVAEDKNVAEAIETLNSLADSGFIPSLLHQGMYFADKGKYAEAEKYLTMAKNNSLMDNPEFAHYDLPERINCCSEERPYEERSLLRESIITPVVEKPDYEPDGDAYDNGSSFRR